MLLQEAQILLGGDKDAAPSFVFIMLQWQAEIGEQYALMNCATTSATSTHDMCMFYIIGNECSIFCLPQNSLEDSSATLDKNREASPYLSVQ